MFRRLLDLSPSKNGVSSEGRQLQTPLPAPSHPPSQSMPPRFDSFEEIYRSTPANLPRAAYSIMKVAEMLNSPHLAGMSIETRRGSVMMALEAAGVDVKDMLQDAMLRNRALDDYEEAQQKKLQDFESVKIEANAKLQAELERITAEYMRLIQSNVDEVASHQDAFRIWQKNKELELQNMAGASAFCSSTSGGMNGSLTMVAGRRDGRA
jgi:hypothetical protein